nr:MAG TPA: hypothetical protein [Caudoviricetes sp.]
MRNVGAEAPIIIAIFSFVISNFAISPINSLFILFPFLSY